MSDSDNISEVTISSNSSYSAEADNPPQILRPLRSIRFNDHNYVDRFSSDDDTNVYEVEYEPDDADSIATVLSSGSETTALTATEGSRSSVDDDLPENNHNSNIVAQDSNYLVLDSNTDEEALTIAAIAAVAAAAAIISDTATPGVNTSSTELLESSASPPSVETAVVPAAATTANNDLIVTTPTMRKRRRQSPSGNNDGVVDASATPIVTDDKKSKIDSDDDDGLTCFICMDSWEMSGEHRLVSLRCGHLFGASCIKRWLQESYRQNKQRTCPKCKANAASRDIRCIYAKRVRAIDRTEEHQLREELNKEKLLTNELQSKLITMEIERNLLNERLKMTAAENIRLRNFVSNKSGTTLDAPNNSRIIYRMCMECCMEISKEPGSRVMSYASKSTTLCVSQKSAQNIFPGFGVRFIDLTTLKPLHFMYTCGKIVRDICLSSNQQQLAVTSLETRCKIYDLLSKQVIAVFTHSAERSIWSCAMDSEHRDILIYLGNQSGSVSIYDRRFPSTPFKDFRAADSSPVVQIIPVSPNQHFPDGGFLVCKLTSVWFYEYTSDVKIYNLNIDGSILSIRYDATLQLLLISTRGQYSGPGSRFIIGTLEKLNGVPFFKPINTFFGSKVTPIMTRAGILTMGSDALVVGYLQDHKNLVMYDVSRGERAQLFPMQEIVYDICDININNAPFCATLTDNKCRIYKVNAIPTSGAGVTVVR